MYTVRKIDKIFKNFFNEIVSFSIFLQIEEKFELRGREQYIHTGLLPKYTVGGGLEPSQDPGTQCRSSNRQQGPRYQAPWLSLQEAVAESTTGT